MTAFEEMFNELSPILTQWIKRSFPNPTKIGSVLPKASALYLYVASNEVTRNPLTASIGQEQWSIWYVGQTENLSIRDARHKEQFGTCKQYSLSALLQGHHRVTQIDMKSTNVTAAFKRRQEDFPGDKHNDNNCRNSIGWSAVTHVTWIDATVRELRIRWEETLIGILRPPLNWLR